MSPSELAVEQARRAMTGYIDALIYALTGRPVEPGTDLVVAAFEAAIRADERARLQASDEASAMPLDPA